MLKAALLTTLFGLLLSGCSLSPTARPIPVPPPTEAPAEAADVPPAQVVPAPTPVEIEAEPPEFELPANCVFRSSKGVAELEQITGEFWQMRFYPGDIAFRHRVTTDDVVLGQEYRAIRYIRDSGPCEHDLFELQGALD